MDLTRRFELLVFSPNRVLGLLAGLLLSAGGSGSAWAQVDEPDAFVGREEQCQKAYFRHFSFDRQKYPNPKKYPFVECLESGDGTPLSHHYNASASNRIERMGVTVAPRIRSEITVGSFNAYHLGDQQAGFKNYAMVAALVNFWDVAALVEIMPTGKECVQHNNDLDTAYEKIRKGEVVKLPDGTAAVVRDLQPQYCEPGYLTLLKELMKLDPTWALLMTAVPGGDSPTNLEHSGFFYRGRTVRVLPTEYCAQNYSLPEGQRQHKGGCLQTKQEGVSREPFIASFKSGEFDFTAAAIHTRFRPPSQYKVFEDLLTQILKGVDFDLYSSENAGKKVYSESNQQVLSRFAEVVSAINLVGSLRNPTENDLILMGDFNFESGERLNVSQAVLPPKMWKFALDRMPGAQLVFNQETTVSMKVGLSGKYDHFVYDPSGGYTSECRPDSAKRWDFTQNPANPALEDALQIQKTLKDLSGLRQELSNTLEARLIVKKSKGSFRLEPAFNAEQVAERLEEFDQRVGLDRADSEKFRFKPYVELLSDHVPISMSCSPQADGDDD